MIIVCWQTILMKYHPFFKKKMGKMSQNLSSASDVIGALRVKCFHARTKQQWAVATTWVLRMALKMGCKA